MEAERNSLALVGQAKGILPVTRFGVFSYAWRCCGPRQTDKPGLGPSNSPGQLAIMCHSICRLSRTGANPSKRVVIVLRHGR